MKNYIKILSTFVATFALLFPALGQVYAQTANSYDDSSAEMHVTKDGQVSVEGAKIIQFAGSTIYASTKWGQITVRWTIKTNPKTIFLRRAGEVTSIEELSLGDYLTVNGTMDGGSESIIITASKIRDMSIHKERSIFSGTIIDHATTTQGLILKTIYGNQISLHFSGNTIVAKGTRNIHWSEIQIGDKIINASGTFDRASKILETNSATVFLEMTQFGKRNFQGTLKSLTGTTLPMTAIITVDGKDYNVEFSTDTAIMNKARESAPLARFIAGDTVRFYGAIQESNTGMIKANLLRNLSL